MAQTKIKAHQWVKYEICPVMVLSDGDGEPVILVDPEVQAEANQQAQYGCLACDRGLTPEILHTPCEGEDG